MCLRPDTGDNESGKAIAAMGWFRVRIKISRPQPISAGADRILTAYPQGLTMEENDSSHDVALGLRPDTDDDESEKAIATMGMPPGASQRSRGNITVFERIDNLRDLPPKAYDRRQRQPPTTQLSVCALVLATESSRKRSSLRKRRQAPFHASRQPVISGSIGSLRGLLQRPDDRIQ